MRAHKDSLIHTRTHVNKYWGIYGGRSTNTQAGHKQIKQIYANPGLIYWNWKFKYVQLLIYLFLRWDAKSFNTRLRHIVEDLWNLTGTIYPFHEVRVMHVHTSRSSCDLVCALASHGHNAEPTWQVVTHSRHNQHDVCCSACRLCALLAVCFRISYTVISLL